MSKDLLLEIGTEEVPAHCMPGILEQLKEHTAAILTDLRLPYDKIKTVGTPRRIALEVSGLTEVQPDIVVEKRGPSIQIAFDDTGKPTNAAQGFARGQKVKAEDLQVKDGYVYALRHEKGDSTSVLLTKCLPKLICGLNFPNNMRWAALDFKFIRPLRWIVALFDKEIIPFTVAEVASGRVSRGHRFLGSETFSIENAADYEAACEKHFIIVDQEKRRNIICRQIDKVAEANGGQAEITADLLEEVTYLVEYPTALCGHFEEKYLQLPPEAVITPMRDHQRYFPVKNATGRLMPLFITVRNGGKEHLAVVQHGNERVLRARLADAQFFFDEDRKKPLEAYLEKLKTVVFHDGLGSIYDKACRLAKFSEAIAILLQAKQNVIVEAKRAALLAKADLATGMVCEFTELQGVMGREYALLDGEDEAVAGAIFEHYKPRFADDTQPQSIVGCIVSIADKIDNIVAAFLRGMIPTGSQDPFALRRQALGMVKTIIESGYKLSLPFLLDTSLDLFAVTDKKIREKIIAEVTDFIKLRVKNVLSEQSIRYDIADAVLTDITDIRTVQLRAQAVTAFLQEDSLPAVQSFVRAANLAKEADSPSVLINEALLQVSEEKMLFAAYTKTTALVNRFVEEQNYAEALQALAALALPINDFFNAVMVMDKDEKIKKNRLGLLKNLDNLIKEIADFTKIVISNSIIK